MEMVKSTVYFVKRQKKDEMRSKVTREWGEGMIKLRRLLTREDMETKLNLLK